MDTTIVMIRRICITVLALAAISCSSPPVAKKAETSPVASPLPPGAVSVDKPVNVSFSTYSKEWPVGWLWLDPDEKNVPTPHDVKAGVLRLRVPTGKDLLGNTTTAPRYVKPITGDFQIETRVRFNPTENYQGAGLLVYADPDNLLRFERAYGGPGGGTGGIRVALRTPNDERSLVTTADLQTDLTELDLKLVRMGRSISAYWRVDAEAEWREAANFELNLPETVLTGIVACNTAREVVAEFQYIRLLPAPK
jgi:regulation of enolase protein 1 (concanavalin A-like superfamily)